MGLPSTSRPFPGFDKLFRVGEKGHPFRVKADSSFDSLGVTRGDVVPAEPVRFTWYMGAKVPSDVIMTSSVFPVIVHSHVIDLLLDHRFSGWGTYPVEIRGKGGEHYPDYSGLVFRGRCGLIDKSLSVAVERERPARKVIRLMGLFFDPTTWDGSDFFMPVAETAFEFATDDVRRVLTKAKVKNLEFIAASEVELLP